MSYKVDFSPEALADLIELYDYIATRASAERAMGYINRIEDCCHNLSTSPKRGNRRDDLRPNLRLLGFERRAVIAFRITSDTVTVLRILYGGRDLEIVFAQPEGPGSV